MKLREISLTEHKVETRTNHRSIERFSQRERSRAEKDQGQLTGDLPQDDINLTAKPQSLRPYTIWAAIEVYVFDFMPMIHEGELHFNADHCTTTS